LWKSKPDSATSSPVDSMNNLYRITTDSIVNYVKTDSIPCYTKSWIAVSYSTNPGDSVPLDSSLIIQAEQSTNGIILRFNYTKTDSIQEYFLEKRDTSSTINVCDYGEMLFKTRSTGLDIMGTVTVRVKPHDCLRLNILHP
jgi:hypothetical protein